MARCFAGRPSHLQNTPSWTYSAASAACPRQPRQPVPPSNTKTSTAGLAPSELNGVVETLRSSSPCDHCSCSYPVPDQNDESQEAPILSSHRLAYIQPVYATEAATGLSRNGAWVGEGWRCKRCSMGNEMRSVNYQVRLDSLEERNRLLPSSYPYTLRLWPSGGYSISLEAPWLLSHGRWCFLDHGSSCRDPWCLRRLVGIHGAACRNVRRPVSRDRGLSRPLDLSGALRGRRGVRRCLLGVPDRALLLQGVGHQSAAPHRLGPQDRHRGGKGTPVRPTLPPCRGPTQDFTGLYRGEPGQWSDPTQCQPRRSPHHVHPQEGWLTSPVCRLSWPQLGHHQE